MKGKLELFAIRAARAVFPDPGEPCKRTESKRVVVEFLIRLMNKPPSFEDILNIRAEM